MGLCAWAALLVLGTGQAVPPPRTFTVDFSRDAGTTLPRTGFLGGLRDGIPDAVVEPLHPALWRIGHQFRGRIAGGLTAAVDRVERLGARYKLVMSDLIRSITPTVSTPGCGSIPASLARGATPSWPAWRAGDRTAARFCSAASPGGRRRSAWCSGDSGSGPAVPRSGGSPPTASRGRRERKPSRGWGKGTSRSGRRRGLCRSSFRGWRRTRSTRSGSPGGEGGADPAAPPGHSRADRSRVPWIRGPVLRPQFFTIRTVSCRPTRPSVRTNRGSPPRRFSR